MCACVCVCVRVCVHTQVLQAFRLLLGAHLVFTYGIAVCCSVFQRVAACCSVLQRVAVCCSLLQCVAVCCSVLQRCASRSSPFLNLYFVFKTGFYSICSFCERVWLQHTATRICNTLQHAYATHCNTHISITCTYYGVASISRLLRMTGLFCKRAL